MTNKEGFGALFTNTTKQNEKSPDFSGSITLNGKEIKLSGWKATSKLGAKYISLRVATTTKKAATQPKDDFINDDMPWD